MIGYSYNGTGIDGNTKADHYIDSTFKYYYKKIELAADFEIGYNKDINSVPLYSGILGIIYFDNYKLFKISVLHNSFNIKKYYENKNVWFIYPRFIFSIANNDISIGPQFTILTEGQNKNNFGFTLPIYWKHKF
jgi:hypothetical protein